MFMGEKDDLKEKQRKSLTEMVDVKRKMREGKR